MSFWNNIKSKVKGAIKEVKKMQKTSHLDAIVAASIWVASADGSISKEEVEKLNDVLKIIPALEDFGDTIQKSINRFYTTFSISIPMGKEQARQAIKLIADDTDIAGDVMAVIATVAMADGVLDKGEKEAIDEIGKILRVNPSIYLS